MLSSTACPDYSGKSRLSAAKAGFAGKNSITILFILFLTGYSVLNAQWSNDPTVNTPIYTGDEMQNYPAIINDGAGGAFIVWEDTRDYTNTRTDIYAQHINSSGYLEWPTEGVEICTASDFQHYPIIVSDYQDGVVIIWSDSRNQGSIFAQRVNASGEIMWDINGIEIGIGGSGINIINDGVGGFIITWADNRNGNDDIYAQRFDTTGAILWTPDGVPVCTATDNQRYPDILSDGGGGAIMSWADDRNGFNNSDIFIQRIDINGNVLWATDGVAVCTAIGRQYGDGIISDGANGAIVVWTDERSGVFQNDLYAQRISSAGATMWTTNGVPVCTESGTQLQYSLVSDNNGGVIIAWLDQRAVDDIYAQRLDENGTPMWQNNGIEICTANWIQEEVTACSDGSGGAIIVWKDERDYNVDIYAQRINISGVIQWQTDGIPVCTATGSQTSPKITGLNTDGVIIIWTDTRNGFSNDDIYGQYVTSEGTLSSVEEYCSGIIPAQFILSQNYPNPFNPSTVIEYSVPIVSQVTIKVFDVIGNEIETLVDEEKTSGTYKLTWYAEQLPAGVYFYRLQAGEYVATKKMVLLK